jgi:WD40 repeat protein
MFAHNDANRLIASSLDGRLSVYQLDAEPPAVVLTLSPHTSGSSSNGLTDLDISTSNELLVSCARDGSLCLWQLGDGTLLRRIVIPGKLELLSCRFLPGNNNLVVCGNSAGGVQISTFETYFPKNLVPIRMYHLNIVVFSTPLFNIFSEYFYWNLSAIWSQHHPRGSSLLGHRHTGSTYADYKPRNL